MKINPVKIKGPWDLGFALDLHTVSSTFLGNNTAGHAQYDTVRSGLGTSLHEKFFETERYADIRRVLDYRTEPEYSQLSTAVAAGSYHPLADELYRYLNFFELIASLRHLNQISEKERTALFDYDHRTLTDHSFVVTALGPQGFEKLPSLLKTIKPVIAN